MEPYVPIFIIVHNQFEILKKTIASYDKYIKTPFKIVYHNVATTYEPTLLFLKEQELLGRTVYNTTVNDHHTVTQTIDDYYKKHPECEYYVMTDPDIELDDVNGDILELYIHTLKDTGAISVGPMLRIDDIPITTQEKNLLYGGILASSGTHLYQSIKFRSMGIYTYLLSAIQILHSSYVLFKIDLLVFLMQILYDVFLHIPLAI
jgi:hypothetical protein